VVLGVSESDDTVGVTASDTLLAGRPSLTPFSRWSTSARNRRQRLSWTYRSSSGRERRSRSAG